MHQTFAASAMSLPIMEEDLLGHVADRRRRQVANTAEEIVDPRPVHPDSRRLYKVCDGMFAWTRYVPIFGPAIECYGPKFVFTLDFTEFMSKGMSYYLMQNSFLPMFTRRFGCSAMDYQRLLNVCMMGWSIKPFSATMSDTFAIFGYTKRWFLVGSAALAAICNIIFGTLPAKRSSAATAAVLAFLAGYGQANLDILSEGLYSRLMRRFPGAGPALVSSLWWCLSLAGIIAAVIVGPLSEGGMEADGAFIAGGCMIVVVPIFAVNLFGEETNQVERRADRRAIRQKAKAEREELDAEDLIDSVLPTKTLEFPAPVEAVDAEHADVVGFSNDVMEPYRTAAQDDESDDDADMDIPIYCGGAIEFNREVLMRNKPLAIYAAAMTLGVIATVIVTINGSTYPLMGVCVVVSAILCAMGFWALPPVAAKANVFTFLNQALYVNIQGPLQTFYTAEEHQYPPGPHFSLFFYITTTAIIGYVAMIIGATLFPYIFAKRSYRLAFIITIFAEIVGSVFDLILVKRWNVDVGIPDHWVYIWGDAVVYQIAYMLAWMPMVVLLSQLCPRGSESIVYALLAGFANFGQRMAAQIGTLLMDLVWPVDTSNVPYDFSNLPNLVIVGHLCIPLLLLPLIFVLIPGARICDELDVDGKVIGEKGDTEREQKPVKTQEDSEEGSSPLQDDATVNIH